MRSYSLLFLMCQTFCYAKSIFSTNSHNNHMSSGSRSPSVSPPQVFQRHLKWTLWSKWNPNINPLCHCPHAPTPPSCISNHNDFPKLSFVETFGILLLKGTVIIIYTNGRSGFWGKKVGITEAGFGPRLFWLKMLSSFTDVLVFMFYISLAWHKALWRWPNLSGTNCLNLPCSCSQLDR